MIDFLFGEKNYKGKVFTEKQLLEYSKLCVINELKKHIEHPNKPGYRRHDILARIKELENDNKT